ncbi:DUF2127 domain-containing protein [Mycobacterium uberis]
MATRVFLPLEVYDLVKGIRMTRVPTCTINAVTVVYLLA